MNILFVSAYVPSPIRVRPYGFIRALARRGHNITLVCGAAPGDAEALDELRRVCVRVAPLRTRRAGMLRNALRALPGPLPLQAAIDLSPALLEAVRNEARGGRYDVAHVEHLRASALDYALLRLPAVLDSVDCISLLFERALRGSPSLKSRALALLDLARTRAYEATYPDRYDRVVVSSPEDAWALAQLNIERSASNAGPDASPFTVHRSSFNPIEVVPNGVDLDYFAPQPVERADATLVFSGKMSYHANEAAALFLAREIMPLVWRVRPDVRLVIAGSGPTRPVRALAADARVEVTGFLPDLRPAIASAAVAVCPLRYGVGIQNKVLEAMALATPVVAARQVARSIAARAGEDMLFAERPEEYAQAILALLDNPAEAARMGAAGRRYVERRHSWDAAAARLEQIYHEAIDSVSPQRQSRLAPV
ncbi:MAG TPA: glycosyltransferase [Roseiflexaceae bacterium]|nr:glycosyltransferase [Roseiflexaceae bacterium]